MGRYYPGGSQAPGAGAGAAPGTAGSCTGGCCVATVEAHYQATPPSGTAGGTAFDDPASSATLANRLSLFAYNAGAQTLEISTSANFAYGAGQPIPAGAGVLITIGPGVKHYAVAASGTGDLRLTELGGTC